MINKNNIKTALKNFTDELKEGLLDAKNMLEAHNFKPFVLPVVLLLILWFGLGHLNTSAGKRVLNARQRSEAMEAEIANESEYKNSKAAYERLAARLPASDSRNEWLLTEMLSKFDEFNIVPTRTGRQTLEDSQLVTMATINYEFDADYQTLGKLVESLENNAKYIRISELNAVRSETNATLLKVAMRVNTIFINSPAAQAGRRR